jgi:dolichyl-phosphate beta-glucosyltransferase
LISIVIPAYNEARRLPPTLAAIHSYVKGRSLQAEVIVIDDGSADDTAAAAERVASEQRISSLRVVRQPNQGKGAAVRTGVFAATGDVIVMTDADMSTPISEMPKLIDAINRGCDVAIGSRYRDRALLAVRQPLYREAAATLYNRAVQAFLVPGIRDTQCGFKAFRRGAARTLFQPLVIQGFAFDVEILYRARRLGMSIEEVPVRWRDEAGSTVQPIKHAITSTLSLIKIKVLLSRERAD